MAKVIVDVKISVAPAAQPFQVDASGMPSSAVGGEAYDGVLAATGGVTPYHFEVIAGSLPDGLSLNGDTGEVSGTPGTAGDFEFEIGCSDSAEVPARVTASVKQNVR